MKLKIFSFFAGSGLLDLGFELNDYSVEFVNEFSASFLNAYKYSRKQMELPVPKYGYSNIDINEYLGKRSLELKSYLEDAKKEKCLVGFIGGPPCPDFSIAGKQKGKDGDNGKLSLCYINLIINQIPDFFLFENVKGLWKTKKHREFYEELKTKLSKSGYYLTDRLINTLEYGAPQDRERIILFGIRKDLFPKGCLDPLKDFPWEKHMIYTLNDIKEKQWPMTNLFLENSKLKCPANVFKELTVQYWFDKNDVENHPNGKEFFKPRSGIAKIISVEEGDDSKKSYKRLHRWRYSPTVAYGNNEVHLHPYKARRLSVAEALSLQSMPREFVLPPDMSLTDKFKTTGNGVPYLAASGIAKTISDFLNEVF